MLKNVLNSALVWRCYELKDFYSLGFVIRRMYFNPYGILLLPDFHDHSRHSKTKILLQLDDDSLCFLPTYAKLLSTTNKCNMKFLHS